MNGVSGFRSSFLKSISEPVKPWFRATMYCFTSSGRRVCWISLSSRVFTTLAPASDSPGSAATPHQDRDALLRPRRRRA
ncbi:hypothetical protein CTI14_35785, partial [Methylobacterium radiotolerans]